MKVKTKHNQDECAMVFEIVLPKETIDQAFDEVYQEIMKVASIPGFRPGKAPLDLIRKQYSANASEEVLKRLIPHAYEKALAGEKISAIGLPEITDVDLKEGEQLSFKAKVDTRPKFKIKDYKGIKVEKKKVSVTEDDIEKTIQNLRELNAKYISEDDRELKLDDYAMADLECFVDGKPIHKKRENAWLFIDKESLIPELNEKMAGMKKDEERDIEVVLPEKYPAKDYAGKRARYHVKLKGIKLRRVPELNDDFAKELGKDNVAELRKEVAVELENKMKSDAEIEAENQLLGKLISDNVFPVPKGIVKRQLELMIEDAKHKLEAKGFRREDLDKKDKELEDKFKDEAAKQVRLLFILDEIAKTEDIKVEAGDLEEAYKSISARAGQAVESVKAHYKKEDLEDNLAEKIREEKVIKFLLANAKIEEQGGLK